MPLTHSWDKTHQGPRIKIHYLVNVSNQELPAHPSTDSPFFSFKKQSYKKKMLGACCWLLLAGCLCSCTPYPRSTGLRNLFSAENLVSGFVLYQLWRGNFPYRKVSYKSHSVAWVQLWYWGPRVKILYKKAGIGRCTWKFKVFSRNNYW